METLFKDIFSHHHFPFSLETLLRSGRKKKKTTLQKKQYHSSLNTVPICSVWTIDHYMVAFFKWLDFCGSFVYYEAPDRWSCINACALNSVLRHIGNPCRSRRRPRSAAAASIPGVAAAVSRFQFSPLPLPSAT